MQGTKVILKIVLLMACVFLGYTETAANTNNTVPAATSLNEASLNEAAKVDTTSSENRNAEGATQTGTSIEKTSGDDSFLSRKPLKPL